MNSNPTDRGAAAQARRGKLFTFTLAALSGAWLAALACGPHFPNSFLDGGDEAVLRAPFADFDGQLRRLNLLPQLESREDTPVPTTAPVPADADTNPPPPPPPEPARRRGDSNTEAELADLALALQRNPQLSRDEREAIVARHAETRARLAAQEDLRGYWDPAERAKRQEELKPVEVLAELPGEFADYFRGALAWKRADTNAAVAAWEDLLARPAEERKFKSTWAAWMLGHARSGLGEQERAAVHFQQVRALAKDGFADSLGLAAASEGWEARAYFLDGKNFAAAKLYLAEAQARGRADSISLRWVSAKAVAVGDELDDFARHPVLRRVVTAYLIAAGAGGNGPGGNGVGAWLAAMESAGVKDVDSAEELALAAYAHGEFAAAARWLKLAKSTPTAQWVQAKLFLREGKLDAAAAQLARASAHFPLDEDRGDQPVLTLRDTLEGPWNASAAQHLHGELAVLRLARREYLAALDTFLNAGWWEDAAYVAERVLTLAELKAYVDANRPDPAKPTDKEGRTPAEHTALNIRTLLARRLVRENRGHEAEPYFPRTATPGQDIHDQYEQLIPALRTAWDESQPREARVKAYIEAGRLVRWHGLELMGTELAPDFAITGGSYTWGITPTHRLNTDHRAYDDSDKLPELPPKRLAGPSADEQKRTAIEPADPPQRFHYRYIAADLLWRAAELLPDQTEEKARVLCEAGTWLKAGNPEAADRYYKALVRKCGRTEIGKLADEVRWFPYLDEQGHLLPDQPRRRKPPTTAGIPPAPPEI